MEWNECVLFLKKNEVGINLPRMDYGEVNVYTIAKVHRPKAKYIR